MSRSRSRILDPVFKGGGAASPKSAQISYMIVQRMDVNSLHFPNLFQSLIISSGLYYKPITIINDYSSIMNKLGTSLIDDDRVIVYNCHMFIVQATGAG